MLVLEDFLNLLGLASLQFLDRLNHLDSNIHRLSLISVPVLITITTKLVNDGHCGRPWPRLERAAAKMRRFVFTPHLRLMLLVAGI